MSDPCLAAGPGQAADPALVGAPFGLTANQGLKAQYVLACAAMVSQHCTPICMPSKSAATPQNAPQLSCWAYTYDLYAWSAASDGGMSFATFIPAGKF